MPTMIASGLSGSEMLGVLLTLPGGKAGPFLEFSQKISKYPIFLFKKKIFIYPLLAALGLHCCSFALVVVSRGYSWLQCIASYRGRFSCWQSMASRCLGFSSCSTWAQQLWHMGWANRSHMESSQTRDQTHVLCIQRQTLIHCTTREVPTFS